MTAIQIAKASTKLAFDIVYPILEEIEKDGFQGTDLLSFLGNEDFKKDLSALISDLLKKTPAA